MTNLQKAAEQGNQAAPNLLDAIKAGEVGGGGGSVEERMYVKVVTSTAEELESTVEYIKQNQPGSNIIGGSLSESNETFYLYVNYEDWLDPLINETEATIEYFRQAGYSEEQLAEYIMILDLLQGLKTTTALDTVCEFSDEFSANFLAELLYSCVCPTPGTLSIVTDNHKNISSFNIGKPNPGDLEAYVGTSVFMPVEPLYLNSNFGTREVIGYGNSTLCYVDAGNAFDQVVADTSDMPDAPSIIRSHDTCRYDAFIIKGVSSGSEAALACIYSVDILSAIDETKLSQALQTKLTAYKAAIEAEPTKYVCTDDIDLCEHIENCMSFSEALTDNQATDEMYAPHVRKNVVRYVISADGSSNYSYVSNDQLYMDTGRKDWELDTSDGHGTSIAYIPSPLK